MAEVGGSLNKRLLFSNNYYDYEMCCFKRKVIVLNMFIDLKGPVKSFLLEILSS